MVKQADKEKQTESWFRGRILLHLGPVLIWTVLWALFFLTILLGRERLPSSDFSGQYHAFGVFQAEELSQGRLPLWSPGSYGGFPFAADTQAATFYPLRWLTILLSSPWGFTFYALEVEAIFHLWLAGLFTYALSYNLTDNRLAGLISAVAFGLGGYLTSFPLLQVTILETFSWLPLGLLLLRLGVGNGIGRSIRFLIGAGLVLGLGFLAGHPQAFLYCAYLMGGYYLFLALGAGWNWRSILRFGGLLAGMVVGFAAVSWLPAAHLTTYATRSDVSYEFIAGGLTLLDYMQFLVPGSLSFWVPEYVGLAPFILALFALMGRKYLGRGKGEVVFWAGAALIAGWLALGDSGVLFQLVYRLVPGFSLFRQQERLLIVVGLALALLAGQGAALWFELDSLIRRRILYRVGIVIGGGMVLAGVILLAGSNFFRPDWSTIWLRQAALLIPVFFLLRVKRPQGRHLLLLVLFLGLDLYAATYEGLDRQVGSPEVYWPEPAWLQDFQADLAEGPLSRIDSRNLFHANIGPVYGLEDMHGISPLKLAWLADFERLPQARRMELMGVSHILAYEQPDTPSVLVGEIDAGLIPERPLEAHIYQVDKSQPRAWMSYEPLLVENAEAAWAVLADLDFDAAAKVVLHSPVPQLDSIGQPDRTPVVETIRPSADRLTISVETARPGLLVIGEWRYPGWQATVDGEAVEIYPADYALQAVVVPAGVHTVELRFRPLDVMVGGILSVLTLLGSVVFVFGRLPVRLRGAVPVGRRRIRIPALPDIRSRLPVLGLASRRVVILAPIFLIAFFLRVHHLGVQELHGDEALSHGLTTLSLAPTLSSLTGLVDVFNPFQFFLLNIWVNLAGDSEFAMRFLAVVPSVLALPLLFVIGRRLTGVKVGLLLVLFFSGSQSLVWLSQDVQSQYMWAVLFLLLGTYLLVRAVERPSWGRWLLYGLVCTLALYSHFYSLFALLAHGLYLVIVPARRVHFRQWLTAVFGAMLLFLPVLTRTIVGLFSNPGPEMAQKLDRFLTTLGQELTVGPAFAEPIGVWIFLGAAVVAGFGWRELQRRDRSLAALFGGWLAIMALGIFIVSFRRDTFSPFYIALAAPAWWLMVCLGLDSLWQRLNSWGQWAAVVGAVVLIGVSGFSLTRYYSDPVVYGRSTGIRPLAEHIGAEWQADDVVVTNSPNPALAYYLRDVPVSRMVILQNQEMGQQAVEDELGALSEQVGRVWFVPATEIDGDEDNVAFGWLDYHTMIEESLTFDNEGLFAFRPSHSVEEVMRPVGVDLSEQLSLAGFYVMVNGRPVSDTESITFEAGDEIAVTLIWDSLGAIGDDYTVFVHLIAEDGGLIAQHDGTPLFGTRPTSSWVVGERLLDRHTIEVSAGMGNGRLVAGMYLVDESGVVRQVFDSGEDAIWLR